MVGAYDANEIWSIDSQYDDKLANYNNKIKYLLVAADVLQRFLKALPMRTKSNKKTANYQKKIYRKNSKKLVRKKYNLKWG